MGSKAAEVWKFVVPVIPCGRENQKLYPSYCKRSKEAKSVPVDIQTLQGEIASVGARVNYIEEQIQNIKAALPELDSKIRCSSLGIPMSSLSLEEMQNLKRIHFQLLHFWEDLSWKQLHKLGFLSDCLQELEERRAGGKSKGGEPEASKGIEEYKGIEQHVSERVVSDLRKNQELEMKLYLDRISRVPDSNNKPTLLSQTPPERGPQRVTSEQMGLGKKNRSEPKSQAEMVYSKTSTIQGHQGGIAGPSTAGLQLIPNVQRCKGGNLAPSTPILHPVQMPSSIKV